MVQIKDALRDEKINIFAMTYGGNFPLYSHQIFLCKTKKYSKNRFGPFVLLLNKTSRYTPSEIGEEYKKTISEINYEHKYIAYVDSYIKIVTSESRLFGEITEKGFFPIWDSTSPESYFYRKKEGYLVVFRVFKIDKEISYDIIAERGIHSGYTNWALKSSVNREIIAPVLTEELFQEYKNNLISTLEKGGWLIDKEETYYYSKIKDALPFINSDKSSKYLPSIEPRPDMGKVKDETPPPRTKTEIYRVLRDTKLSKELKILYDYKCQICGKSIRLAQGNYAEAHHIQPLSQAHEGPDIGENIIILCPNHHVEFDYGVIAIEPFTFKIMHKNPDNKYIGKNVFLHSTHTLNPKYLSYHIDNIYNNR